MLASIRTHEVETFASKSMITHASINANTKGC